MDGGMNWIIRGQLAGSARPGYSPYRTAVGRKVVDAWLATVRSAGITSVICLLDKEHLCLYESCPDGLIAYYRAQGLCVKHLPVRDHKEPPMTKKQLAATLAAFHTLPKPVLVHCSAGAGRTGAATRHICTDLGVEYPPYSYPLMLGKWLFDDKGVSWEV